MRTRIPHLSTAAFIAILAGCDQPTAPTTAPPARDQAGPRILVADQSTAAIGGLLSAAGVDIPPVTALANLAWGQLAGFKVRAEDAACLWERLRAVTDATGYYPIIAVSDRHSFDDSGVVGASTPISDLLDRAAAIDPVAWFENKERENQTADPRSAAPRGPWVERPPRTELETLRDVSGQWRPDVYILLLPTREPWQAPLYLGWGGWNECPSEVEHAACLKRWHSLHGAEPMLIADSIIEARVARPPRTNEEALALAREQFLYCTDIVHQGVGTLDALGAELKNSPLWYFWWD